MREQHEAGGVVPFLEDDDRIRVASPTPPHAPTTAFAVARSSDGCGACVEPAQADDRDGQRAMLHRTGAPLIVVPRDVETVHVLDDVALRDVVEVAVDDAHVLDRRVGEAAEIEAVWALLGS